MATSNLRFRIIGDDDASSAFLKVAAAAKLTKATFDDFNESALGLTKLIGGAGLIPVLAGAAAAATELGVALGAAAGAGGVFGLSVGGFLAQMVKQQQTIASTQKSLDGMTKGTQAYRDELAKLQSQQQAFNQQFGAAAKGYLNMKSAFQSFLDATGPVTKGVLAKGFNLIASVLPKLVPVSNAAGKAVGGLLDDLRNWTKSPQFNAVLKWLKDSGPKAITAFGHAIGNVVQGLGGILSNFVGPGDKAVKTLENLTKRFAEWGKSKGVSDSVNKFLQYISNNGPQINSVFASLADAAPKLAVALGNLGQTNLNLVAKSLQLIAGLPQGAFNAIAEGLFGIAVATKAVNIAMGIGVVIQGVATALNVLNDACLGTRIGLMALAAAEKLSAAWSAVLTTAQLALDAAMDANPIGLVVIALAALVAGLIYAYKHSETFRNIVNGAFNAVAKVVGVVVGFIKSHWLALLIAITGPTGIAIALIVKNWDKVSAALKAVGSWGRWLWNSVFEPVFKFIVNGVADVLRMWAALLHALAHVPGFGWVGKIADALDSAAGKASALADAINKIPTHHQTDIVIRTIHDVVHTTGGHVPAFASGTSYAPGGMALVGERGPELVDLPRGSRVYPASQSRQMMGGGVTVIVNAGGVIGSPDSVARDIEVALAKLRRQRGGNDLAFA